MSKDKKTIPTPDEFINLPDRVTLEYSNPFPRIEQILDLPGSVSHKPEVGMLDYKRAFEELQGNIPDAQIVIHMNFEERQQVLDAIQYVFLSPPLTRDEVIKIRNEYQYRVNYSFTTEGEQYWVSARDWLLKIHPSRSMMKEGWGTLCPDKRLKEYVMIALQNNLKVDARMVLSALCCNPSHVDDAFFDYLIKRGILFLKPRHQRPEIIDSMKKKIEKVDVDGLRQYLSRNIITR